MPKLLRPLLSALLPLLMLSACSGTAVHNEGLRTGLEMQAYPVGFLPGIQLRHQVGELDAVFFRLGANFTDRADFGEHASEKGTGFGLGMGWRHMLTGDVQTPGWLWGARVDMWDLEIDWQDPDDSGTTQVLVVQPTVEVGYGWILEGGGRLEFMLGAGAEINFDTDGEDVGEGAIGLLGLTWYP